jgi:hypothetical protein
LVLGDVMVLTVLGPEFGRLKVAAEVLVCVERDFSAGRGGRQM